MHPHDLISSAVPRNWWVSWYCPAALYGKFELHSPWWVSGERMADGALTICAAIKGHSEGEAQQEVVESYDDSVTLEWRFVEERPTNWSPFCDRFQKADWMKWTQ